MGQDSFQEKLPVTDALLHVILFAIQVLERICPDDMAKGNLSWIHTKCLYRFSDDSRKILKGVTDDMCRMTERGQGVSSYPRPAPLGSRDVEGSLEIPEPGELRGQK
jgi:hypothetical protein